MKHAKQESRLKNFFFKLYTSYIPNGRDNIKQIIIKVFFLISLVTLIVSAAYLTDYFLSAKKQDNIIEDSRNNWHTLTNDKQDEAPAPSVTELMLNENSDFKGWITIAGTKVDNPIYQTDNNDFYLDHNQRKEKSAYGALFFDYGNKITATETDLNLVIYGHHMKNGSMFGTLSKYKSLDFYKKNPVIDFSTLYKTGKYKIYSIFVLNANKADDDNYIYNLSRKSFFNDEDFNSWTKEAYDRSLINTGVDVKYGDNIITLVTCTYDFDNARLIIMARETREDEENTVDTSKATYNPTPRYPKRWYDDRGITYPFAADTTSSK